MKTGFWPYFLYEPAIIDLVSLQYGNTLRTNEFNIIELMIQFGFLFSMDDGIGIILAHD